MTKQEEIREGIAFKLFELDGGTKEYWDTDAKERKEYRHRALLLVKHLHSQGAVLKVEDQTIQVELPADGKPTGLKLPYHLSNLGENIAAVEPLIGVNG